MNDCPRTNRLPDKRHQVLRVALINLSNSDSPETFGAQHFNGNDYERLGGVALASSRNDWALPIGQRKVGFIDFNFSME
jgi:hypothetical protein